MVFLVPLGLTIWLLVNQLQDINLDPQTFIAPMQQVAEFIKEKTGYDVLGKDTLSFIVSILPRIRQIRTSQRNFRRRLIAELRHRLSADS